METIPENKPEKKLCAGLLAHVDAGKTTLSEAMLYTGGALRRLGRVDHQNAFLDNDAQERERGITIFSKQAVLQLPGVTLTLLDTPGHVDFSGEMERALQVLDLAVLVISGTDGVQSHTRTVWQLLKRRGIPVFLFVNKMDLPGADREALLAQLRRALSADCVECTDEILCEEAAARDETLLSRYLESDTLSDDDIAGVVAQRKLFPCCFGSALRLSGVDTLLDALCRYTHAPQPLADFGACVYKIARDAQGARLTFLKITGGVLRAKTTLSGVAASGRPWEEKADQLRIYSGARFAVAQQAGPGTLCAVTGLTATWPGEGLGAQPNACRAALAPVLTCQVLLPEGADPQAAFAHLRQLEEEEPQLTVVWNDTLREICIHLMGEIQLEVLRRQISDRFGLAVEFGPGNIVYRETIAAPVEGVGHFEPLRHYAEVHLLLEPGEAGSGLRFAAACPDGMLSQNWQQLVLTHLAEKQHRGVLMGAPITDMKITLVAGRAHQKHTEGGDFRQATWRAVRQGLKKAESILLEPWYDFRLETPAENLGRAIADIQRMGGSFSPPQTQGSSALLTGYAPVSEMRGYSAEVAAYTRGSGSLACTLRGYAPCHDAEAVLAACGYDADRDTDNPAGSVFCAHGAGHHVPWNEVEQHMHVESGLRPNASPPENGTGPSGAAASPSAAGSKRAAGLDYAAGLALDRELEAIFRRTYGPVAERAMRPTARGARTSSRGASSASVTSSSSAAPHSGAAASSPSGAVKNGAARRAQAASPLPGGPEYLLVDGYNIIFAWDDLHALAQVNIEAARRALMDALCNYRGFRPCRVILVFDAYKVRGGQGAVERYHNIDVVYTREAETADMYIEKVTYEIGKRHRVRVVTSDGAEQLIILGHGALRISARAFRAELDEVNRQIAEYLDRQP